MKLFLSTQVGFLIGDIILFHFFDVELKILFESHILIALGYICRLIQK